MSDIWDDLWGPSEEVAPPESFNALKLARYFRNKYEKAPWNGGMGSINMLAFAAQIKRWKGNVEHDTVIKVMDAYFDDASNRGKNPGWQDFVFRANVILQKLGTPALEDEWTIIQKQWEREHGIE